MYNASDLKKGLKLMATRASLPTSSFLNPEKASLFTAVKSET